MFTLNAEKVAFSTYIGDEVDQVVGSVVFKLSNDRIHAKRVVYSLLDYFANVGGLFVIFNRIGLVFTLCLSYNGVYHKLTSDLFKVETNVIRRTATI